ncbi:hypothetical protein PS2_033653 [Malus domestica]
MGLTIWRLPNGGFAVGRLTVIHTFTFASRFDPKLSAAAGFAEAISLLGITALFSHQYLTLSLLVVHHQIQALLGLRELPLVPLAEHVHRPSQSPILDSAARVAPSLPDQNHVHQMSGTKSSTALTPNCFFSAMASQGQSPLMSWIDLYKVYACGSEPSVCVVASIESINSILSAKFMRASIHDAGDTDVIIISRVKAKASSLMSGEGEGGEIKLDDEETSKFSRSSSSCHHWIP